MLETDLTVKMEKDASVSFQEGDRLPLSHNQTGITAKGNV
ncbi:hypothetical protein Pla110_31920 [Polystyrenella longa]|uniref:Uncharacterized protein n=1 Tax=Polystyrenella longa TaxID=2528007 RepID=A0A518CQF5_9PLAN|nr:hypothetical protein Pla110_31920 [Polystyrenella longa]